MGAWTLHNYSYGDKGSDLLNVPTSAAFRYFLIQQIGPNSSGNHRLCISGIDFYGYLIKVSDALSSQDNSPSANKVNIFSEKLVSSI